MLRGRNYTFYLTLNRNRSDIEVGNSFPSWKSYLTKCHIYSVKALIQNSFSLQIFCVYILNYLIRQALLSGNHCRTRDVSQLVERLLSMHKALVQFPALHKPGVVGHTYNLLTWVEGQWRLEDPKFKVTSGYTVSSRSSWVTLPFLQKRNQRGNSVVLQICHPALGRLSEEFEVSLVVSSRRI